MNMPNGNQPGAQGAPGMPADGASNSNVAGNTAAAQAPSGPAQGGHAAEGVAQGAPGIGHGAPAMGQGTAHAGQHLHGPGWAAPDMPPPWMAQAGYAAPAAYPPAYAYYGMPGAQMPPSVAPPGAPAGMQTALNEAADNSGLGMLKGLFNMQDGDFWKGALVGAAVVLLMTNEDLRSSLVKGAAKTADAVKSGFGRSGAADAAEGPEETVTSNETEQEIEA